MKLYISRQFSNINNGINRESVRSCVKYKTINEYIDSIPQRHYNFNNSEESAIKADKQANISAFLDKLREA